MFSQSMKTARSSGMDSFPHVGERPGSSPGLSVDLLYTVAVVESDDGLGEGLSVEDRLHPQDAPPLREVFGEVEGRDYRHRLLRAVEPDGVLLGLHEHLAVVVAEHDPRPPLLVRGVLAALELGVDDEGGLAFLRGQDLIEYPEQGEPVFDLGATLREDERRALDHAVAGVIHAPPRRSERRRRRWRRTRLRS